MTYSSGLSKHENYFKDLQGNILKPHGRNNISYILISFAFIDKLGSLKDWIRSLPITSFQQQLDDAEAHRNGKSTETFYSFFLTYSGYSALGYSDEGLPIDESFRQGMKQSGAKLNDPDSSTWDISFRSQIDAIIMLADDDISHLNHQVEKEAQSISDQLNKKCILGIEAGEMIRDSSGMTQNHFGFRDGVSNPIFLQSDISKYENSQGSNNFDPRAEKELVLTQDPYINNSFGSFVVLRKLEQNVRKFREAEITLAQTLGLSEKDTDYSGALAVGRFRDGTPISISSSPNSELGAFNNFNFIDDPSGSRCPFHSHIRKVNDRGESLRKGAGFGDERRRRIVRRGFAYGTRSTLGVEGPIEELPESGVGIHFLAYQANIGEQFEHLQLEFSNNPDYFVDESGIDPVIGQTNGDFPSQSWPVSRDDSSTTVKFRFGDFVKLKGGEYLYAPPLSFLKQLPSPETKIQNIRSGECSTSRTKELRELVISHGFSNRKKEWFTNEILPDLIEENPDLENEPLIIRKALASKAMLQAMVNSENNEFTRTYEIRKGELIVGTIPLGSVGLGKKFPRYLTDAERRASSLSNRDEPSVFGHTTPNFTRILEHGLLGVIKQCNEYLKNEISESQQNFYNSVIISCKAVIEYAEAFATLADSLATNEENPKHAEELRSIADVCRKVPAKPAESFHEALQCVWFLHLAQTSFCVFNSLGRLDQVFYPYYLADIKLGRINRSKAVELVECFLIKFAERLHLNPAVLRDQDNLSYGTGIGTRPIYLDQVASCNNFIQNIVLSGIGTDGQDMTNEMTYIILEAVGGVGLCTPTIDVRVHSNSPEQLLEAVDKTLRHARTGHPILFNDDTIIKGMVDSGIPLELARDYSIAGCWEPVLSGKCSFIFGMVNMLRVVECALNEGMLFNSDPQFLKGQKQSLASPPVEEYRDFSHLISEVRHHMRFFSDKVALGTSTFFMLPGAMTPTPFFSALLDGCLERGIDQSMGGADYNLISNIAFGVPNAANALANIHKFVFIEKRWSLREVTDALRINWGIQTIRGEYEPSEIPNDVRRQKAFEIRRAFLEEGPKYGNNDPLVDDIMSQLMSDWAKVTKDSGLLAKRAFLSEDKEAEKLRAMANYPAPPFTTSLRQDFELHFTTGSGTFGQYSSLGKGVSASADGRAANDPVVPNCSPESGTARSGIPAFLQSLQKQQLSMFGSAVVTDIRIDGTEQEPNFFANLTSSWVAYGGSMLTISVLSTDECQTMLRLSDQVRAGTRDVEILRSYADRFCRVGGWNSGFICLPRSQQRDHLIRAQW